MTQVKVLCAVSGRRLLFLLMQHPLNSDFALLVKFPVKSLGTCTALQRIRYWDHVEHILLAYRETLAALINHENF